MTRNNFHTSKRLKRSPEYWHNRAIVLRDAGHLCAIRLEGVCTGKATQTDHIIPVSEGIRDPVDPNHPKRPPIVWANKAAGIKMDSVENLRAACPECNAELNYRNRPKPPPRSLKRKQEEHPGRIN